MIPTIAAPKKTLCGPFEWPWATVEKLRNPGLDAANDWIAFYMLRCSIRHLQAAT